MCIYPFSLGGGGGSNWNKQLYSNFTRMCILAAAGTFCPMNILFTASFDYQCYGSNAIINRRLGAKGSYLTLVRVADRII